MKPMKTSTPTDWTTTTCDRKVPKQLKAKMSYASAQETIDRTQSTQAEATKPGRKRGDIWRYI
ncbi:hypothetical protein DVH05_026099 [Phytophthora capsici]|nr:hypothetical protein DVH05_026099 [Phytophthora capsici]